MALTLNNMLPAESSMTYDGGNYLLVVPYFETTGPGHFKMVSDFDTVLSAGFILRSPVTYVAVSRIAPQHR